MLHGKKTHNHESEPHFVPVTIKSHLFPAWTFTFLFFTEQYNTIQQAITSCIPIYTTLLPPQTKSLYLNQHLSQCLPQFITPRAIALVLQSIMTLDEIPSPQPDQLYADQSQFTTLVQNCTTTHAKQTWMIVDGSKCFHHTSNIKRIYNTIEPNVRITKQIPYTIYYITRARELMEGSSIAI